MDHERWAAAGTGADRQRAFVRDRPDGIDPDSAMAALASARVAMLAGAAVVIELEALRGRARWAGGQPLRALLRY